MAKKHPSGAATVVRFPSSSRPTGAAHGDEEEQLARALVLQHQTIRNLEYALACMAYCGGDAAYRSAARLIEEVLADLKGIGPGTVSRAGDLTTLCKRLKDCNDALALSRRLIGKESASEG